MLMNKKTFLPNTLYQINLQNLRIPITGCLNGLMNDPSDECNYNVTNFRENLENLFSGT